MSDIWFQDPDKLIRPQDIVPGHRIAFYVKKWHGMYKMQVARVEHQADGTIRIKAGVSAYTYWFCRWHILEPNERVWLLGKDDIAHALMLPSGAIAWTSKLGWLSNDLKKEYQKYSSLSEEEKKLAWNT